jgi:hypothetical protein
MRLFFHLTNGLDYIRDEDGIDVADLEWAQREAQLAILELEQEDDFDPLNWEGWRLEVTDQAGVVVMWINLGARNGS